MSHAVPPARLRTRSRHRFAALLAGLLAIIFAAAPPALAERATIDSSGAQTCAVRTDQGVSCWGAFSDTRTSASKYSPSVPTDVPGAGPATSVATGTQAYQCAVRTNGSIGCWGGGYWLDYDVYVSEDVAPVDLVRDGTGAVITDFVDVAVNDLEGCGVRTKGLVVCWRPEGVALPISNSGTATSITSNGEAFCAVRMSGKVMCWDRGLSRQYGPLPGPAPVWTTGAAAFDVPGISTAVSVSDTCALLDDGTVSCWSITHRPRANEEYLTFSTPAKVPGVSRAVDLAVGRGHGCVVDADDQVGCWGDNSVGQLGMRAAGQTDVPFGPASVGASTDVSVTGSSSCARLADASVRCWGANALLGQTLTPLPVIGAPVEPSGALRVAASTEPRPTLDPQRPSAPLPDGSGFGDVTTTAVIVRWAPPRTIPASGLREYVVTLGDQQATEPATERGHQFTGLTPNTRYTGTVVAIDNDGHASDPLAVEYTTMADLKIGPPVFGEPEVGPDSITLHWEPSGTLGTVNFRIEGAGVDKLVPGSTRSYTLTGLQPDTAYPITVTALDGEGQQSAAATTTVTTAPRETAPPTPIPEVFTTNYRVTGTTTIPTLTRSALPITGAATLRYDYSSAVSNAELTLNDTQARVNALGFLPITATVGFVTSGTPTSERTSAGVSLTAKVRVKVKSVKAFGAIPIAGGNSCQTRQLSTLGLKTTDGYAVYANGTGTFATGYAISDLNGCGILGGLVSPLVAGSNNMMSLTFTRAS